MFGVMDAALKSILILQLLTFAAGAECPDIDEISCSSEEYCVPIRYLCDGDDDCVDGEDEGVDLCQNLRDEFCDGMGTAECTRNEMTTCEPILDYCTYMDPPCTGQLDQRICHMLMNNTIQLLEDIMVMPPTHEVSEMDLEESESLAEEFKMKLNMTIGHQDCPSLYTLVGDQCISLFTIGSVSWGEARAFCEALDGDLITFNNPQHYAALVTHLSHTQLSDDFWVGGRYVKEAEEWHWINDVPMELGTPYWAVRYHVDECKTRNMTMDMMNDPECYNYVQAPRMDVQGSCVAITFKHYYYMSDEDCLTKRSPMCVLKDDSGKDDSEKTTIRRNLVFPDQKDIRNRTDRNLDSSSSEENGTSDKQGNETDRNRQKDKRDRNNDRNNDDKDTVNKKTETRQNGVDSQTGNGQNGEGQTENGQNGADSQTKTSEKDHTQNRQNGTDSQTGSRENGADSQTENGPNGEGQRETGQNGEDSQTESRENGADSQTVSRENGADSQTGNGQNGEGRQTGQGDQTENRQIGRGDQTENGQNGEDQMGNRQNGADSQTESRENGADSQTETEQNGEGQRNTRQNGADSQTETGQNGEDQTENRENSEDETENRPVDKNSSGNSGFKYNVINDNTNFGHEENIGNDGTQGTYFVDLPDGRTQRVTYNVSGGSGFVANVEYIDKETK